MDVGTFMICSFGTVLLLGDHTLSEVKGAAVKSRSGYFYSVVEAET